VGYFIVFLLFGFALDGFNISAMNLVIEIAPEDKRPIYTALQTNLSSIGLFFPLLGAALLNISHNNYTIIYLVTVAILALGLFVSLKLKSITSEQ
jgi:MFS family permease